MFSDTPLLKTTLDAKREDKDGAVFYRLSDPTTGREYRLYEVEYLIAQMLDGRTLLSDIATRVRDELKFNLSPNDLERFVRELESLGFLSGTGKTPTRTGDEPMSLSADDIIEEASVASVAEVDRMAVTDELERLVRSALLHVKQGMVAQARDYFLAAKKYAPSDEKVGTMLNHLDVVGEDDGPSDIEYLWKQAVVLYPELTQEIGPAGIGIAPIPVEEQRDRTGGMRTRLLSFAALTALVIGGFIAWELVGRDWLRPAVEVETDRVRSQKVHLFYDAEATEVGPRESFSHAFEKTGVVVDVLVKTGESITKGQVLARQRLPAAEEKQLAQLRQKRQTAEKAFLAQSLEVEKLSGEIASKSDDAEKTRANIDELQKGVISRPAVERSAAKKELAAAKKTQATLKKELAALKKKITAPLKSQTKLKKTFDTTLAAEEAVVKKNASAFLRANADGYVTQIAVDPGMKVEPSANVITVADTTALRIRFKGTDRRLQVIAKDTKIKLFSRDSELSDARVASSGPEGTVVETTDHEGHIAKADRRALKLVRETLDNALIMSAGAHLGKNVAYVIERDTAVRKNVDWVEVRGREAIARSGLQQGDLVVSGPDKVAEKLLDERVQVRIPKRGVENTQ